MISWVDGDLYILDDDPGSYWKLRILVEDVWSSELVLQQMSVSPSSHTQHSLMPSFGWKMRCCSCCLQLSAEYIDDKISFLKGATHKQAPLLMKDSRSDCLAVRQIKSQRRSAEWADRHESLLCLHEERSQRSLKFRKQDQKNKSHSITYRDIQKVWRI